MGLKPDLKVAHDLGVSVATIVRWSKDPKLKFAPRIRINGRNYRDTDAVDVFVAEQAAASVAAEQAAASVTTERVERGKARATNARAGKKQRAEAQAGGAA
jgi:hypothetical protein